MSAPPVSVFKLAVSVAYLASALALVAYAVYVLRLRCEGFGCTGIGIAWVAWAGVFVPVLAVGAGLRSALPESARVRSVISWSLLMLLAVGVGLVVYWVVRPSA